ncbi:MULTISPECIES: alpha/beta hydrolase [unclassified Schaalia]|uniref:alpha/beta hydrolase n=1 Tax=unclassified Schaalia TaxID=2691889 RepID=UPI001E315777|nr:MULTISPECIES: alpha/beta hydrolase [unclassified Schaalia]MCD4548900.1 alpha/beta hydrolase [Schaalia sp. lx-260]MCD4557516.1 alpha/beta hydrolase [Schaalia sp. lx-100]
MNHQAPKWPAVISIIAICIAAIQFCAITGIAYTLLVYMPQNDENSASVHPTPTPSHDLPKLDGSIESFYSQPVQWSVCDPQKITKETLPQPKNPSEYECARVQAPVNWEEPEGETLQLALAIHRAKDSTGEALFFNLGGPGGAAVSSIANQVEENLGKALTEKYDIVALDPRGVGDSTPLKCLTDEERDKKNAGDTSADTSADKTPEQIVSKARQEAIDYAKGCETHSGNLYKYVDTVSVAKDFDMVRALLQQDKLNYLGYSYGTFLGATYADNFADKVGRFVLDGAVDPAADVNTVSSLQMRGFEESIRHWAQDCLTSAACPLKGNIDEAMQQMARFLQRLEKSPVSTQNPARPLTQNLALTSIIGLMYSTDTYDILTQGMTQVLQENDGTTLLFVADLLNDRHTDGSYDGSSSDALNAVNNLDYTPVGTIEEWAAEAEKLKSELVVMGPFAGWASAGLEAWPTTHAQRHEVRAAGAAPIVVVGTTHDPATPYVMSQSLAQQLESGVLVSWEGWNHTAYSAKGSRCVAQAVESYFTNGTVPENGVMCTD